MAAGGEKAGHHPVARLEALDFRADFFDDADELVAEELARAHRYEPVVDMQVRTAHGAERDPYQDVARILD